MANQRYMQDDDDVNQPARLFAPLPDSSQYYQQQQPPTSTPTPSQRPSQSRSPSSQSHYAQAQSPLGSSKASKIQSASQPTIQDSDDTDVWHIDHSRYHGAKSMTFTERFMMKANQDPFVPIGCALTLAALSGGLWSFMTGRRQYYQKFMWARVSFQGATLGALAYAMWYKTRQTANGQLTAEEEYRKRYD